MRVRLGRQRSRLVTPSISSRRKRTQSRSPPSGNGKGPLPWAQTVTEARAPARPWLGCPAPHGEQTLQGLGRQVGDTLPTPHSAGGKAECPAPSRGPPAPAVLLLLDLGPRCSRRLCRPDLGSPQAPPLPQPPKDLFHPRGETAKGQLARDQ